MGLLGALAGGVGGYLTGGPGGALVGALGGWGDGKAARSTSGMSMRPWTPQEQAMMDAGYAGIAANQRGMSRDEQNGFISRATADYFNPMSEQITQGYQNAMGQNAVRNARGGMTGSTQAYYGDQATARGASGALGDAAARSRQLGQQDFYNWDTNRRADLSSDLNTVNSGWSNRYAGSDRWSEQPTGDMATGMGLFGAALGGGSPYLDKFNSMFGGGGGGGGGGMFGGFQPPSASFAPLDKSKWTLRP